MFSRIKGVLGVVLLSTLVVSGCSSVDEGKSVKSLAVGNQKLGVSVHDPSIVKSEGRYYLFGSHMEAVESDGLTDWKGFARGVTKGNQLFDNLFTEEMEAFSYVGKHTDGKYAVWAPDVIYNKAMGKWVMYFATSHDFMTSTICFATADTIKGPYTYQDKILYSGFGRTTIDKTNFKEVMGEDVKLTPYLAAGKYNHLNYPNCIDPSVFYDKDDKMWMVYGSWSGGIWLLQIDEATGYPIHPESNKDTHTDRYFGQYLIGGLHLSCEGPYILYDANSQYYYLFVSYGELTREGGYQIRQFRSTQVGGPYVDAMGQTFGYASDQSPFGVKMMGNYSLPSLENAYMAPGHNSALIDDDGKMYLVYHQRFDQGTEYHEPRVHQMFATSDGWLVAAPFATMGEGLNPKGYKDEGALSGVYYTVNHGLDIGANIHDYQAMTLTPKGTVMEGGKTIGTYTVTKNTCEIELTLGEVVYQGVVIEMTDEAGNQVRCISAVGNNNETIWLIYYFK